MFTVSVDDSMKTNKLRRHLKTLHHADKPLEFFQRKRAEYRQQSSRFVNATSVNQRALLASYKVAYQITQCKKLSSELSEVMTDITGVVNFIKTRPLKTRVFSAICEEMGAEHQAVLFHSEARWLSRGEVLS